MQTCDLTILTPCPTGIYTKEAPWAPPNIWPGPAWTKTFKTLVEIFHLWCRNLLSLWRGNFLFSLQYNTIGTKQFPTRDKKFLHQRQQISTTETPNFHNRDNKFPQQRQQISRTGTTDFLEGRHVAHRQKTWGEGSPDPHIFEEFMM